MSNVGTAAVTGPAIQVGTLDVVTGNYVVNPFNFFFSIGVDATVLMNDGHGGLVAAAGSPILVSLTQGQGINVGVSLGDMNGDGKLDMVVADPNGEVAVFLGDGHGGFSAGPVVAAGLFPWALALADLNGDGRLDIVTGNVGTNTLSVVLADGLGGYAAAISIPAGIQPVSLALGDVNGDGTVDIIAGNDNFSGPGSVTVALNDGHGGFSTTTVPVVQDPFSVALGDLNGDGHLDLVVSSGVSEGTVDVLLGDGLGGFTRVPGAPFATGQVPLCVALGDLNGDGLLDIVVANTFDSNLALLFGDGHGAFTAQTLVAIGPFPRSVALADVNGDGMVDIVTTNLGGSVSVALNDGHGGFGAATTTQINATPFVEQDASLALGNLDNVQTTAEDTNIVFDAAHDNAIRVSDLGAGGASETLTLTVLHGALTLATTSNLSIVANAGGSSIQVTGTLADINAALDGLIYRPDQDYNGTDTLTLDLNDNGNNGGAAQSTSVLVPIDVTAVNDAPVITNAIPDQSVAEDTAWSFQFVASAFTDPEGDAITFTATLANGDQLPAWLGFNAAARTFSGTPPTDFNGPIDLKVSASDGALARSDTFTLTVTPVNDAPVLSNAIADQSIAEDTAWSFQFAANAFTDIDGDALIFTATLGNGDPLPAWLSFNAAARTFSGTPPTDFNGPIDLKVTASDGSLARSDTFTLTVTPVNDAPVLSNAIADQSVAEDTAWSFQFAANAFTDPEGDAITFTATLANGDPLPAWLSFDAAARTFSGTAPIDFNGPIDLKVAASDGTLARSDTFTLTVTPVNDAPVLSSAIADQSVAEDTAWSFQFAANAFTDPDGDAITFTATLGNGDPLPAWLSFNAAARTFSGTPPANFNGAIDLKVTASDGTLSNFDTFTLAVTPVKDAPVLADLTNASYRPHGTPVTLSPALTLSDVDSGTLIGATVHIAGGTFAGDGDMLAASVAGTAIAASYSAATETLTLSGTDTLAHYSQVLASVTFESTAANPSDTGAHPTRTVAWQVNDGGATDNLSNVETTTIDIGRSLASNFGNTGHSGILWQNADGTPAIWLLDGTTLTSGANVGFNPGTSWHAIGTGDFNGDGKADLLWQNLDGAPAIWLMDGQHLLAGANVGFNPGPAWHVIGAGDFDGDGKADILWQNQNGQAAVWLMDGQALKSGSDVGPNPGASWHVIGSGDFNGDGKADILWQNQNGQAAVWLMDGRTLLSGANVGFNPGTDWHVQGAGDFNGDGKADILWQNTNGQAAVWMMDGQNLISGNNVGFNPGTSWQVHGTGDFNGDGKADIQWQNTDGTPAVWLMDGYNVVVGSNVGFDPGTNWHVIPPHHDALV
jgi:hypothetical protein